MIVKPLTEHHLECLSIKGGCRGSSGSALVKMSDCLKSHAAAIICFDVKLMNLLCYAKYALFSESNVSQI